MAAFAARTAAWRCGRTPRPTRAPTSPAVQLAAGAVGLTVATVAEAEVFADAGLHDLFIAYPLWVDAARAPGCGRSPSGSR